MSIKLMSFEKPESVKVSIIDTPTLLFNKRRNFQSPKQSPQVLLSEVITLQGEMKMSIYTVQYSSDKATY